MSISYTIRSWAAENKRYAQTLMALSTVALFYLGHILGVLAEMLGWDPYAMFLIGAGTGILTWTLAPRRGEDFPIRYTYARQKVAVVIMFTNICFGVGGGAICLERFTEPFENPLANAQPFYKQSEAAKGPKFFQEAKVANEFNKTLTNWFHGGISRRVLKQTRRLIRAELGSKPTTGKLLLHIGLAILITWAVLGLIIPLACYFHCYGFQSLAIATGIGGLVLLVFLLVELFKSMKQYSPSKGTRKKETPSSS